MTRQTVRSFRGEVARFAASGALVAVVYFSLMTALSLLGLRDQIALAIAYGLAVLLHFALNRQFVFATGHGYALHITTQGARYLTMVGVSYALTALALAFLPASLGVPSLAVYFAVAIGLTPVNFMIMRVWVFRPSPRSTKTPSPAG